MGPRLDDVDQQQSGCTRGMEVRPDRRQVLCGKRDAERIARRARVAPAQRIDADKGARDVFFVEDVRDLEGDTVFPTPTGPWSAELGPREAQRADWLTKRGRGARLEAKIGALRLRHVRSVAG